MGLATAAMDGKPQSRHSLGASMSLPTKMSTSRRGTIANIIAILLLLFCLLDKSSAVNNNFSDKDPYKVLGVKLTASDEEIQKAYRQKARETHPDKNPSPRAAEEFRRVADAYEILGDPANRRRHDARMQAEDQRRRQARQRERQRDEERRRRERREKAERQAMADAARRTRDRVVKLATVDDLERTLLNASKGVYQSHVLIMFVSNKNAERRGDEEFYFPYPFAGEVGGHNPYEGTLRVAKVRFNAQTDLTRLFRAKSRDGNPHIVFARKGDVVSNFQIFRRSAKRQGSADVHSEFKQWVESRLLVVAVVANQHSLPVDYLVLRNGRVVYQESLEPNYQDSLSLLPQDRIVAFDQRLDSFPGGNKMNHGNFANAEGALLMDAVVTSDGTYAIPRRRCYDLSAQCHSWTKTKRGQDNNQCHRNPEFMHHVCPYTCGVCSEHFASDFVYLVMHCPMHRLPSLLYTVARSGRLFAGNVGNVMTLRKNAAVAFFAAGLFVPFNVLSFRANLAKSRSPLEQSSKDPSANLVLLLDLALLLLSATICTGMTWMISTPFIYMPSWLRGFQTDLVAIARYPDIFTALLGVGVIAVVSFKGLTHRLERGNLNYGGLFFPATALLTLAVSMATALLFNTSSIGTPAIRWQILWNYHKNAAFFVSFVGALGGAAFVSLKRLTKSLQKRSVMLAFSSNLIFLAAICGLAFIDKHFKADLLHVMEIRTDAAFALVVSGVLAGKIVIGLLCGKSCQGGYVSTLLGANEKTHSEEGYKKQTLGISCSHHPET